MVMVMVIAGMVIVALLSLPAWPLPLPDNAGLVCYRVCTCGPPALSAIVLVNTMCEGPATHMRVAGPKA